MVRASLQLNNSPSSSLVFVQNVLLVDRVFLRYLECFFTRYILQLKHRHPNDERYGNKYKSEEETANERELGKMSEQYIPHVNRRLIIDNELAATETRTSINSEKIFYIGTAVMLTRGSFGQSH